MKALLLTPYVTAEERYGEKIEKLGPLLFSSLGIAYVAAVLEKAGHKISIIDSPVENMTSSKLKEYLSENQFDVIGISVLTPMYAGFVETLRCVKSASGDAIIIAGGPHPSIFPKETLEENPELDYVVYGEGEITTVELFDIIKNGGDISSIKGIAYRDGKNVQVNPPREFINNLDEIPLPSRHLMSMEKYIPAPSTYRVLPALNMITTRGCPFNCIYCSSRSVFGKVYRSHSVKRVLEEIEHLIKEYGAREIYFLDDLFTFNKDWVNELCDKIVERGLNKKLCWSCNTRVNLVSFKILRKMKKAGCWQIHYGIESGSQRLINLVKKGITLDQARNAIKWTRQAGIQSRAYFMLGLPTETPEESRMTINFAKEINPDYAKFSLTTPYPGTELFEMVKSSGDLKSFSWKDYKTMGGFSDSERPYVPKGRTSEELNELQKNAHKEFYFRPGYLIKHFTKIRSLSEFKTTVKSALALFKV